MRALLPLLSGCVFWFAAVLDVRAVTTVEDAAGGCDGIKNGRWGFHTASGEQDAWWQVDLGKEFPLDRVVIFNRTDGSCAPRTSRIRVLVAGSNGDDACKEFKEVYQHDGTTFFGVKENKPLVVDLKDKNVAARIVRLQVRDRRVPHERADALRTLVLDDKKVIGLHPVAFASVCERPAV